MSAAQTISIPEFENSLMDESDAISVDTETTGLRWRHGERVWSVSMCDIHDNSWYCEWLVDPFTRMPDYTKVPDWLEGVIDPEEAIEYIKSIVQNPDIPKVYHNAKFDIGMLSKMGIIHQGEAHDTTILARVVDSDEPTYKLKPLAEKYCGIPQEDLTELKKIVGQLRKIAKRLGWKIHKSAEADYWLVQYAPLLITGVYKNITKGYQRLGEQYCRMDTLRTIHLYKRYEPTIEEIPNHAITYDRELELQWIVKEMEDYGIRMFRNVVEADREYSVNMAMTHMNNIVKQSWSGFNPNSTEDLGLFMKCLGIPPVKFTDNGNESWAYKVLKDLEGDYPVLHDIIQWKAHSKAVGTFFDTYLELMLPDPEHEGCYTIHPNFNQANARTGRFSSNDPNLQQVSNPDTSFKGSDVIQARGGFGPREGTSWLCMDYSQMELRIFAGVAQVDTIIDDILSGRDPNTEVANKAWGGRDNPVAIRQAFMSMELGADEPSSDKVQELWDKYGWNPVFDDRNVNSPKARRIALEWLADWDYDIVAAEKAIDKKMTRNRAKMVMFAKLYGGGDKAVAELLMISREEAKIFMADISRAYPQIDQYMRRMMRVARDEGCIINKYGRILKIPRDRIYTCVNYMVQGTAADMMKLSMISCYKYIKANNLPVKIVATIHDEIIFEIDNNYITQEIVDGLKFGMENHQQYVGVPMEVGVKIVRKQWSQAEGLKL